MQRVGAYPLIYEFRRDLAPRASIESGETFVVEAEDALSGQIRSPGDRRDRTQVPFSNPVAGPIEVRGAEVGDVLAISIQEIRPRDGQCATYTGPPRQLAEWLGSDVPHGAHVCPIRDGQIHWNEWLTIPYAPMLGCVGTAPHWGTPSTVPAGPHGGNLDLVEVAPGSIVYLPVFVPGGWLYMGDAHAAMGHGELSATGLEMASETTVRVDIHKSAQPLAWPRIETADELISVVSGNPMERSLAEAFARLILWLEADFGWNRWHAYDLLTHVARVSVGYYAIGTVGVKVAKRYVFRS